MTKIGYIQDTRAGVLGPVLTYRTEASARRRARHLPGFVEAPHA